METKNEQNNLTEADFKLIGDALESSAKAYSKGLPEVIIGNIMESIPAHLPKHQIEADIKKMIDRKRIEYQTTLEDIRMLQGKLILMKRQMIETELISDISSALNAKTPPDEKPNN